MMNDKQAIRSTLKNRLVAQRDFMTFCKYTDPKYPSEARHLQYLTKKLEQVKLFIKTKGAEGIGRLMIYMPPRYWKSQTASRKFPAWVLGDLPDTRFILTSYGADLATKHSREVRDLIQSDRYQAIFGEMASVNEPVMLDPDSRSAAAWEVAGHSGGMLAAGVGGAITGFGALIFIIDDPVKSRDEASSAARREMVWEWYRSTAYTRLEDGAAIIVIQTRWDVEDLGGKLLNAMVSDPEADQWDVVMMPAIALEEKLYPKSREEYVENLLRGIFIPMGGDQLGRAPGEALWGQKQDDPILKAIAANMGDFEFGAQFQQLPRLAEGEFLDDRDFQIIDRAPEGLKWYWYMDLALGESETSDFNCTGGVAFDAHGNLYLRDMVKIRELEKFLPEARSLMLDDEERGAEWGVEDVAFQKLVFKEFMKDKALVNKNIRAVKPNGDKVERARPWRRRAKQGKFFLIRGKWNLDFVRTAAAFPKGRHDDEVDMVSGAVQMIAGDDGGDGKTVSSEAVVMDVSAMFASVTS